MNKYMFQVTENKQYPFNIVCGDTVISSHKTRREALDTITIYYHGDAIYGSKTINTGARRK